ncbi:hypothetical protein Enr13x_67890 [Stieleria neptunia]|uniref:Protein kinase domain-containing protein n=1 Tax=Stieleria neptunia TaxID=2527979 RepID=A0A518I180_9BACT|nr:hypothetical protein [Stieleria neptunia]QDV46880.1 hypothetical protein Enr13x_67890 [Stieleria neptunia]
MTRHDVNRSEFSTLDAGKLLPGCSLPISAAATEDRHAVHAFRQFEPLPIDGLTQTAQRSLADSWVDVARSLKTMHDAGLCYGRITSTAFHNRGSETEPVATLWIDPSRAIETDAVHHGDPESMYWTAARLQSGKPPQPADDWYALGIVLAEISLSSASVHKIWELSRQDGKFVESLIKNLKRARSDRRLRKLAIALIRQGATGKVDDATIDKLTTRPATGHRTSTFVSVAVLLLALVAVGVTLYRNMNARHDRQIAMLAGQVDELQRRAEAMENATPSSIAPPVADSQSVAVPQSVAVAVPEPAVVRPDDRGRWTTELAGRSLEQAIEASVDFQPSQWRDRLIGLQQLPGQKQWRTANVTLRRLIQQAVDKPWDDDAIQDAQDRIASLGRAHARWTEWARSNRSVDEIRTQHDLMPSGLVKEFLGQWLGEALELRSFDLRTRVVKADEGNTFLAHVIGFETPSDSESVDWAWESTDGGDASIAMQIDDYRAGQALSYWLKKDSSIPYWDKTVIEHTFDSPLLAWQLAKGLRLENSESGYAVLLSTNARFGPPVKLETSSVAVVEAEKRKVVDPMDDLPFGLD